MGAGWEDMEHAPSREGGEFPDVLTSGNGTTSVLEYLCPCPLAQLVPLHGSWVYLWRRTMGAFQMGRTGCSIYAI